MRWFAAEASPLTSGFHSSPATISNTTASPSPQIGGKGAGVVTLVERFVDVSAVAFRPDMKELAEEKREIREKGLAEEEIEILDGSEKTGHNGTGCVRQL